MPNTTIENRILKRHMTVAQNTSGRNLNVPIYQISSGLAGPTVYIQSSIHGAEVQGNVVIFHLINLLKNIKVRGKIVLVPNCNPVGANIKAGEYTLGRFDPVNGTNWNRGYHYDHEGVLAFAANIQENISAKQIKTQFRQFLKQEIDNKLSQPWGLGLAQQLNLSLQQLAIDADYVLDLHTGPVSTRHIYIPEYAANSAKLFSIPHCIFIPNVFSGALDEATFCPWWTLQETLKKRFEANVNFEVEAFTLEMGSQEVIDFSQGEQDAKSILTYLAAKGAISTQAYQVEKMTRVGVKLQNYKTLFSDFGGMVEYCVKPGELVKKGQTMANILNIDDLDTPLGHKTLKAPCDLIPMLHFPSASVLSGTQLYKCFTDYFVITE